MENKNVVWPSWGLPLAAMPSSTIEDLVVRATRLPSLVQDYWSEIDRRNAFEGGIQRPFDSPMSLYLIRGRWLLVESSDFSLELWDLDAPEYNHPSATYVGLEGPIDGITHVDGIDGVKITLSTSYVHIFPFYSSPVLNIDSSGRFKHTCLLQTFHFGRRCELSSRLLLPLTPSMGIRQSRPGGGPS